MPSIRFFAKAVWRAILYIVVTIATYLVIRRALLGEAVPLGDEASLQHFERWAVAVISAALAKSFFTFEGRRNQHDGTDAD